MNGGSEPHDSLSGSSTNSITGESFAVEMALPQAIRTLSRNSALGRDSVKTNSMLKSIQKNVF